MTESDPKEIFNSISSHLRELIQKNQANCSLELAWIAYDKGEHDLFDRIDPTAPWTSRQGATAPEPVKSRRFGSKKSSPLEEASSPIIDLQVVSSKKMFSSYLEECGYNLLVKTADNKSAEFNKEAGGKKALYFSYIRKDWDQESENKEDKTGFFGRKKKSKPKWTPAWMKDPEAPPPITHVALAVRMASQTPPGFSCIRTTPSGTSAALQYAGTNIPLYACFRRGFGPQLVNLQVFEVQNQNFSKEFYFVGRPLNVLKDGKPKYLAFKLDLSTVFDLFQSMQGKDAVFGNFLVWILACCYSQDNSIATAALDTTKNLVSAFFKNEIPATPLNYFLIQLSELAITFFVRGASQLQTQLLNIAGELIIHNLQNVWPSTTTHFFYSLLVTVYDESSKTIHDLVSNLCRILVDATGGKIFEVLNSRSEDDDSFRPFEVGIGSGVSVSGLNESFIRRFVQDLVRNVTVSRQTHSLFQDVFLKSTDSSACPGSIALEGEFIVRVIEILNQLSSYRFKEEPKVSIAEKHAVGIIVLLSRVIAEPFTAVSDVMEEDESIPDISDANEAITEDAAATAAATAAASTSKKMLTSSIARSLLSADNKEWNALLSRKLFAIKTLQRLVELAEKSFSWNGSLYDENDPESMEKMSFENTLLVRVLRAIVVPALVEFIWWALRSEFGRVESFHVGMGFFQYLWNSERLHKVLRVELGLVWDRLFLGILSGEIDIKMTIQNALTLWKTETDSKISMEEIERNAKQTSLLIKIDLLECINKLLPSAQHAIDMFYYHDLDPNSPAGPVFERTCNVLSEILKKFDFAVLADSSEEFERENTTEEKSPEYSNTNSRIHATVSQNFLDQLVLDESSLRSVVDSYFKNIRNESERLAISSLILVTRILENLSERVFAIDSEENKIKGVRAEAMRLASLDRFDLALRHVILYTPTVFDAGFNGSVSGSEEDKESSVTFRHKHSVSFSFKKSRWRATPEIQDEITLLLYHGGKNGIIPKATITDFLISGKGLPAEMMKDDKFQEGIAVRLMDLIWIHHIRPKKKWCMFRCLQSMFSSPWLLLPSDFNKRKTLLESFSSVFYNYIAKVKKQKEKFKESDTFEEAHEHLEKLSKDQILLITLSLTTPLEILDLNEIIQPSLPIRPSVQVFLYILRESGKEAGLVGGDAKKTSLPKILVDHLSDWHAWSRGDITRSAHPTLMSNNLTVSSRESISRKSVLRPRSSLFSRKAPASAAQPSVISEQPKEILVQQLHDEPNCQTLLKLLASDGNPERLRSEYAFPGARSYRLIHHMLDATWHLLLPVLAEISSKLQVDGWKRDDAVEAIFFSLDAIQGGVVIGIGADNTTLIDSWITELAKIRYFHLHFRDSKMLQDIPTGKFLENQKWVETVKRLSLDDKDQACNQLFIVESTKKQIEFNFEQEKVRDLEKKLSADLNLLNGERVIFKQGKLGKVDFGSYKASEEWIYLFSDLIVTASGDYSKGFKFRSLIHLSAVRVLRADEARATLTNDDWRSGVRGREDRCLVMVSRHCCYVLVAPNQHQFDQWSAAILQCTEDTQRQHQEKVQFLISGGGGADKECSCALCLKAPSLFHKLVSCVKCEKAVCPNCMLPKEKEKVSVCEACFVLEKRLEALERNKVSIE